ncbi:peptidase C1B, bleomycin hydrolase [Tilletiaria anomala UBC 951]|uniref:Cysteine proteinase 1, mitochondrial n=1 Tax=Tilletiaria anomala (strain ATCC 24038 / CBS 436.72 / UBC 951) TaxID=1037660 RepID=A0A066VBK7_TILAU|nr:peptidase C1B, bleomycin hydrolase [Tilletiaria anomala UBC 951]KDN37683.1 peptidase C1B, bleomycin hydrolase [Tilletiaria anomala UBC 951]
MGSAPSKPASPTTPVEKSNAAYVHHVSADRTARIQAEQQHRASRWTQHDQLDADAPGEGTAEIALDRLDEWHQDAFAAPTSRLAAMTLHNANIADSLHVRDAEITNQHVFTHSVPLHAKAVTNQKSSGRCWLFALTNLIRLEVIKQLDIKDADFELSQSYLHFCDKLEKANFFLENVIELADRAWDDRELSFLSSSFYSDGGQWDMVTSLIVKYGVVPQSVFPESFNSSNTSRINWLVTVKVREMAQELRDLKAVSEERLAASVASGRLTPAQRDAAVLGTLRAHKQKQMKDVYRMLAIAYGKPPRPHEEFEFSWYDSKGRYQSLRTTPYDFQVKYTGTFTAKGSCSLVHDPRNEPNKLITVSRLGNIWGAEPVRYVNTDPELMMRKVVESVKAGHAVFFGCDVGQFSHTPSGIMDTKLYDYEHAFGITLGLTKKERLQMGESQMTHAMVIDAVHLDAKTGAPLRFAVQNSWGSTAGKEGYMVMSAEWFCQFVYQVVIRKEFVPKDLWTLFENGVDDRSIVLPCYDPMGALA